MGTDTVLPQLKITRDKESHFIMKKDINLLRGTNNPKFVPNHRAAK